MQQRRAGKTRSGKIPFGALQPGQQFRILDARGAPVMAVLYTRIRDTMHRGRSHNALGWGMHPDGRQGRRYCTFAPATLVMLDTFNVPADPADDEVEFLHGTDTFDPATTPGPPRGIVDPNLDDLW